MHSSKHHMGGGGDGGGGDGDGDGSDGGTACSLLVMVRLHVSSSSNNSLAHRGSSIDEVDEGVQQGVHFNFYVTCSQAFHFADFAEKDNSVTA